MSKRHEGDNAADRREFLKLVSVAGAASALPFAGDASGAEKATASAHAMHDHKSTSASLSPGRDGYEFFNTSESAFIEAAVDTLIPADAVGPGALELGVATYFDRQMAGSYGGAVFGLDPATSVLNKYLQVWDVPNVFVTGACVFPQNAGKNPTGPVGALAYWAADAIKNRYLKSPGPLVGG